MVELGEAMCPAFRALPAREREIVRLRFFEDLTQSEIAARIGVSQMHVSPLALLSARSLLGGEKLEGGE